MTTVLPTPAPPNRPILPPFGYGAIRSTTLMPVSSVSTDVDWSTNSGAGRWIGRLFVESIGPRSSTGSPITFMMRPSVFGPDRHRMPSPVFVHRLAADEAVGRVHRDAAHGVLAEVLRDLDHEVVLARRRSPGS